MDFSLILIKLQTNFVYSNPGPDSIQTHKHSIYTLKTSKLLNTFNINIIIRNKFYSLRVGSCIYLWGAVSYTHLRAHETA